MGLGGGGGADPLAGVVCSMMRSSQQSRGGGGGAAGDRLTRPSVWLPSCALCAFALCGFGITRRLWSVQCGAVGGVPSVFWPLLRLEIRLTGSTPEDDADANAGDEAKARAGSEADGGGTGGAMGRADGCGQPKIVRRGRVVEQPGDGNCLYHSLACVVSFWEEWQ